MKIEKRTNYRGTNYQVSYQSKGASILSQAVRETSISGAILSGLSYSSFIQSKIGHYISGTGLSGSTSGKDSDDFEVHAAVTLNSTFK